MSRTKYNKDEFEESIDYFSTKFKEIAEESDRKNPDTKKINELAKESQEKILNLKTLVAVNPASMRKQVTNECVMCRKEFTKGAVAHLCGNPCTLKQTRENKIGTWENYYAKFSDYYKEHKQVPKFTWAHRQQLRRRVPENQKEMLLKIDKNFFDLIPVEIDSTDLKFDLNIKYWLSEDNRKES